MADCLTAAGSPAGSQLDDLGAVSSKLFAALAQAIRTSNALPGGEDLAFEKSVDSQAEEALAEGSARVLALANRLIAHTTGRGSVHQIEEFADLDHVCDRFDLVVDTVDALLEEADSNLDEASGSNKASKSVFASTATKAQASKIKGTGEVLEYSLIHAAHIPRPQLLFADEINNSPNVPWMELLKEKPHAMVPFKPAPIESDNIAPAPHPYEYEINHYTPPEFLLEWQEPIQFQPFEETSATWIDTKEDLCSLIMKLEQEKEIAVDLEAHDFRSYLGIVCLLQLSTRDEDFLIDTLKLRSSMHLLNNIFADPNIIKVFHGAQWDIVWLQRDFGLYVVGLFDTYHASHVLEMGQHSLAYLLQLYADFLSDKRYQLADWRIRPLPAEMERYARSDTHFLLYVYDCMRNELISRSSSESCNLLLEVMKRSARTSLLRFQKPGYDAENGVGPMGWKNLLAKYGRLGATQAAVFQAIHAWRDRVAREEDESPRYVMPNHMLYAIATRLPKDVAEVYACCTPTPPLVRTHAGEICQMIDQARQAAVLNLKTKTDKANTLLGDPAAPVNQHIRFDEYGRPQEAGVRIVLDDTGKRVAIPLLPRKKPYVPGSQPKQVPPLKRRPRNIEKVTAVRSALFRSASPPRKRKKADPEEAAAERGSKKDRRAAEATRRVLDSMALAGRM